MPGIFDKFKPYIKYAEGSEGKPQNTTTAEKAAEMVGKVNGWINGVNRTVNSEGEPQNTTVMPQKTMPSGNAEGTVMKTGGGATAVKKEPVNYDELDGDALISGLAPISEEEQQRRANRSSAINAIGHFSQALGALGNVFNVRGGAPTTTIQPYQPTDIQAYNDKIWNQRQSYNTMQRMARKDDVERRKKENDIRVAQQKADAYVTNMDYKNKRIESQSELDKARMDLMEVQSALYNAKAQGYPLELQAKLQNIESQIQYRLSQSQTAAFRAETSRDQGQQRINQNDQRIAMTDAKNAANDDWGEKYKSAMQNQNVVAPAPAPSSGGSGQNKQGKRGGSNRGGNSTKTREQRQQAAKDLGI